MRTCKIPCEYPEFEKIRDAIYATVPFAVIHIGYSSKLKVGIFNFWDSDYIPDAMKPFILQPPAKRENHPAIVEALEESMKQLKKD